MRKRIDDVQGYELTKGDYEIGLDFFEDGGMPCLARTREAAASLGKVLTEHLGEDGVQVVPGDWNVQRFDLTDWIARLRGVRVGRSSNTSSCEQAIPLCNERSPRAT